MDNAFLSESASPSDGISRPGADDQWSDWFAGVRVRISL